MNGTSPVSATAERMRDSDELWHFTSLTGDPVEHTAVFRGVSGRRLRFELSEPVSCGMLCRLQSSDSIVMGEVVAIENINGGWLHTLYVHQSMKAADIRQIRAGWTET